MELFQSFKKPGSAYRRKPFWAWNGVLDADHLNFPDLGAPEAMERMIELIMRMESNL